jgi:hypothetical protein
VSIPPSSQTIEEASAISWERGFNRSLVVVVAGAAAGFALYREAMQFPVEAVWQSFQDTGDLLALWDALIGELAVLGSMALAAAIGLLFLLGWALCGFFSGHRETKPHGRDAGP